MRANITESEKHNQKEKDRIQHQQKRIQMTENQNKKNSIKTKPNIN